MFSDRLRGAGLCVGLLAYVLSAIASPAVATGNTPGIPGKQDLERLVQETHAASIRNRRKFLIDDLDEDVLWPDTIVPGSDSPWGAGMWALSALYTGRRMDEANEMIRAFAEKDPPFGYFVLADYVRKLSLFHSDSEHLPGRLHPETEKVMKRVLWDVVYEGKNVTGGGSRIAQAAPDAVWFVHGSENHDIINKVNYYLICSVLKDDPAYGDRKLKDGATVKDHFGAWNEFYKVWLRERATKGLWVEIGSDNYQKHSYPNILNLYDLAPDPEIQKLARMFLDISFIEEAQMSFSDGFRGGGKSRVSRHKNRDLPLYWDKLSPTGALGIANFTPYLDLLFGQGGPSSHSRVFETSTYQVPDIAVFLRMLGPEETPLTLRNRVPGENEIPRPSAAPSGDYALSPDSALINYCYRTQHYMLGSTLQDPNISYSAISMQDRWSGIVFNDERRSRIIPHPEPSRAGPRPFTRTHDAYWNFQHENIMVVQRRHNARFMNRMRIYFSPELEKIEKAEWVFVDNGRAFAAVRPAYGGYRWYTGPDWAEPGSDGTYTREMMLLNDDMAPVIFYAGDVDRYSSFDAFMGTVLASRLEIRDKSFVFEASGHPEIEFFADFRLPWLGGEEVNLRPDFTYNSPYLRSDWQSYEVIVEWGDVRQVYDFENAAIIK